MKKHKPATDQKLINAGPMPYLMRFPAQGRTLRVTISGAGVVAAIADDLGASSEAVPFSHALRSLRVERARQTTDQVIMWSGSLQYVMPWPAEGRLIQVKEEGAVLVASIADELGRPQDALPFTCAFRSLHVGPVLDHDFPFKAYDPGVVYRR
jgi:hypothetical protein